MKKTVLLFCLIMFAFSIDSQSITESGKSQKRFTVLGLGDSITEGGDKFQSYLFSLWEMLFTAGYDFDFIGPHASKCRIGTLNNSGFSGKNAQFLDDRIDSIYRIYPADIVLLHSGHNHDVAENPVAGIIAAQLSIIHKIIAINPKVKILVAQVIQSGKLPKYSYIPELNKSIAKMVKQLNSGNVILVNQSKGFDWKQNTIADNVHPNSIGAKKMAKVWFSVLSKILQPAEHVYCPELIPYKKVDSTNLTLHVFNPTNLKKEGRYPCIIYFFGGGWATGSPLQFYRECAYYSSKGMVAIAADYRISSVYKSTPFESIEDAKDAIRFLRNNASKLCIDPDKIVAAGSSAGGQLAASTGIFTDSISCKSGISFKPNLMFLYYPVVDNSPGGYGSKEMKDRFQEISPLHNINAKASPALFILGTKDPLIPVQTGEAFKNSMDKYGVNCEFHLYEGAGHPIFSYTKPLTDFFYKIRTDTDNFLMKYGYLKK